MISELELGLACALTSDDVSEKIGYGTIFGNKNGFGSVCSVANVVRSGKWVRRGVMIEVSIGDIRSGATSRGGCAAINLRLSGTDSR